MSRRRCQCERLFQFGRQLINLSANLPHKKRGLFVPQQNLQALTTFFAVQGDEEIILSDEDDVDATLLDAMQLLTRAGFTADKDFVDGLNFMLRAQCGKTRPEYHFIRAM